MSQISSFKIEGLYNARTINLQIEDNTLILVGENGTGKSTVVNILYFFLTSQWSRIDQIQLKSVSAVIDDKTYSLSKEDIKLISEVDYSLINASLPASVRESIKFIVEETSTSGLDFSPEQFMELSKQLARNRGISPRMVQAALKSSYGHPESLKETIKNLPSYFFLC